MKLKIHYSGFIRLCMALFVSAGLLGSVANAEGDALGSTTPGPTSVKFDVIDVGNDRIFVSVPNNYYGPWNSPEGTLQVPMPVHEVLPGVYETQDIEDLGDFPPLTSSNPTAHRVPREACWYNPDPAVAWNPDDSYAFRGDEASCGGSYVGNAVASMNSTDGWSTVLSVRIKFDNDANGPCDVQVAATKAGCPGEIGPEMSSGDYHAVDHVGLLEAKYDPETKSYLAVPGAVPVSVSLRISGSRMFIYPLQVLSPSTSYVVYVTNGVKDTWQKPVVPSADYEALIASYEGADACAGGASPNPTCDADHDPSIDGPCDAANLWGGAGSGSLCQMMGDANHIVQQEVLGDGSSETIVYAAVYTTASTAQGIQAIRNAALTITKPVFDCLMVKENTRTLSGREGCAGGSGAGGIIGADGSGVWGDWNTVDEALYPERSNMPPASDRTNSSSQLQYPTGDGFNQGAVMGSKKPDMGVWFKDLYAMKIVSKRALGCTYPQPVWEDGEPRIKKITKGGTYIYGEGVQSCTTREYHEETGDWFQRFSERRANRPVRGEEEEEPDGASLEEAFAEVQPELESWGESEELMQGFDWNNYVAAIRPWGDMRRYHGAINLPIFLDSTYDTKNRYPGGPQSGWKYNQYRSATDSTWAIHQNWENAQANGGSLAGLDLASFTPAFQGCVNKGTNCGMQTTWNPNGIPFADIIKLRSQTPADGFTVNEDDGTGTGDLVEKQIDVHRYVTRYAPLPQVSSVRQIHFTLLMPKGPQVRRYVRRHGGVPIVVYTHGVTIFKSTYWMVGPAIMRVMRNKYRTPVAVIAISQPLHSDRRITKNVNEVIMGEGGETDVYINIEVPAAVVGNYTQSLADTMGLILGLRLAKYSKPGGMLNDLNADRILTLGHSLGALTNFSSEATGTQSVADLQDTLNLPLPYTCSGVGCRKQTPFNPVAPTAGVYADPGQGIAAFMLVAPTMSARINAIIWPATPKYKQWFIDREGSFPANTCDAWDIEQNKSANCVALFKQTFPFFTQSYGQTALYVVQTKIDQIDPSNSVKFMNPDHPFIQINATYEGTIPTWVYDNPLSGGAPLANDPRWGTGNNKDRALLKRRRSNTPGLTILNESIKCRDHVLRKCPALQVVGYYGGTRAISSTLMGPAKTLGDFAYHITFLGVPYRMHLEMIRNAASLFDSGGTEIHVRKDRFLEDKEPPVCYITHNGLDVTFTGIPLPVGELGSCPRGATVPGPKKEKHYKPRKGRFAGKHPHLRPGWFIPVPKPAPYGSQNIDPEPEPVPDPNP